MMNMLLAAANPVWLDTLIGALKKVIGPVLILIAMAGTIYAIVVGVRFVKADSKDEREEAKQKLISVIIGIVVTFVLIALFYWLAWAIDPNQGGIIHLDDLFK